MQTSSLSTDPLVWRRRHRAISVRGASEYGYLWPWRVRELVEEHAVKQDIDPDELIFRKRAMKDVSAYRQVMHVVSALRRFEADGFEKGPGHDVQYVVVDDGARLPERVRHRDLHASDDSPAFQ